MTTVLITGATRGLGRSLAGAFRSRGADVLAGHRSTEEDVPQSTTPVRLDLADLAQVRELTSTLSQVDVVVCNAGVQRTRPTAPTVDGLEQALQVNVLAHLALVDVLAARHQPPQCVVFVGSQTHDPAIRTGTAAPDERPLREWSEDDIRHVARGDGIRRYATTKLLVTALTGSLARAMPRTRLVCFDPGMMPGTGLARDRAPLTRALWSTLMRGMTVLPFASTPARSSAVLADHVLAPDPTPSAGGTFLDHRGSAFMPSSRARDPRYQDEVLRDARALLEQASPTRQRHVTGDHVRDRQEEHR